MANLKELIDEVLYNKRPGVKKKSGRKSSSKELEKTELANENAKKTNKSSSAPKKKSETSVTEAKNKTTKTSQKASKAKEITEEQEDELGKRLAWKYFWWVKKGNDYGLATFAARATRLADRPTATSRDIPPARRIKPFISLYMKPLEIMWLVTDDEVKKSGANEYYDYLKNNDLPLSLMLNKSALNIITNEVDSFIARNIGHKDYDEYTPEEKKQLLDLEEQTISAMRELPIGLDNKQLTKEEVSKIHDAMKSGHKTTTKYWLANLPKIIKNVDTPNIRSMAKKALK